MKLKTIKSLTFLNSSPDAIVFLVPKVYCLHSKPPEFRGNSNVLKLDLSKLSQSKGSIGRALGFVIDRLNTSASLYRIAPCLSSPIQLCQMLSEV